MGGTKGHQDTCASLKRGRVAAGSPLQFPREVCNETIGFRGSGALPHGNHFAGGSMNRNLARYLQSGQKQVHGWLDPKSSLVIASLSNLQVREGLRGGICEIGVHHGKLFLLMALSALPEEKCVAIDVFGRQDLNLDGSGKGDRAIFEANMQRHGVLAENVQIVEKSSLEVS